MKDHFGCRSYFDFAEGEEQENLRQIYMSFLF